VDSVASAEASVGGDDYKVRPRGADSNCATTIVDIRAEASVLIWVVVIHLPDMARVRPFYNK